MAAGIVRSPDPIVISKRVVNMDMLLKGKRALITGSTSGIGAQCARVLAGEGVSVVINGRSADRAAAVTEEIRKVGGEAKFVLGDVTTEDGSNAVIEGAKSAFDGIDILVNNVGNPTQESHDLWFDAPFQEWIDDYHQNTPRPPAISPAAAPTTQASGSSPTSTGVSRSEYLIGDLRRLRQDFPRALFCGLGFALAQEVVEVAPVREHRQRSVRLARPLFLGP